MINVLILILAIIVSFIAGTITAAMVLLPKVLKKVFAIVADEIKAALTVSPGAKATFADKIKERVANG